MIFYFKVKQPKYYRTFTFEVHAENREKARRKAIFICFGHHAEGIFIDVKDRDELYKKLEEHRGDKLTEITKKEHLEGDYLEPQGLAFGY